MKESVNTRMVQDFSDSFQMFKDIRRIGHADSEHNFGRKIIHDILQ